jgi:RimJ/RimL family protein N-acetyltransferase
MRMDQARLFEKSYTLKNGEPVTVRSVRPDDRLRVRRAFEALEPETVYHRFHGPKRALAETDLDRVVDVDYRRSLSLLATIVRQDEEIVIGGAQYVGLAQPHDHAEIAFTIEEDFQNNGLATILLRELGAIARQNGFVAFEAFVLQNNRAMLKVFERSGFAISKRIEGDSVTVQLTL